MSKGFVYILSNPCMPGLVKIGKTTRDPAARAHELYQTGVPVPFVVEHSVFSPDCHALEADMHEALAGSRIGPSREFFAIDARAAARALDAGHLEQVTDLIQEFLPNHKVVDEFHAKDEANMAMLCTDLDIDLMSASAAIDELKAEELIPALERWKARLRRMRAAADARADQEVMQ